MASNNQKPPLHCIFCGKTESDETRFIQGPGGVICEECISLCYSLLNDADVPQKKQKNNKSPEMVLPKPSEMKDFLDQYVIGQDDAKVTLSVAVYNHYKRIFFSDDSTDVELQKSNVLLLGPTGVGKTLLASTLAKLLKVPFAIADATTLTEAGYVGDDVENILLRLIQNADYDIGLAERGIIYIDEIDKISRKSENTSITRDVSGEGVQQALLKILEGTVASVPPQGGRKHPQQEMLRIDTTNILFICGGAFDGLEKIVTERDSKGSLGFGGKVVSKKALEEEDVLKKVIPHDLVKFGIIPELIGRLPVIASLEALSTEQLTRILKEPKNSLVKQYTKLLMMDKVELEFQDEALKRIAEKAIERKTGARGLRSIIEEILTPVMFAAPSDYTIEKIVITAESVDGGLPEVIHNKEREPVKLSYSVPARKKDYAG